MKKLITLVSGEKVTVENIKERIEELEAHKIRDPIASTDCDGAIERLQKLLAC